MSLPAARIALLLSAPALLGTIPGRQDLRFEDSVDVDRVIIDARVLTSRGRALLGLTRQDFEVRIDGREARLESVRWVAAAGPGTGRDATPRLVAEPAGRLILLLFQKGFESSRLFGLIHIRRKALELLETLGPADRVAVLSFDSHLKLWTDFTADKRRLKRAIEHDILFEERPGAVQQGALPSLLAHFDFAEARRAATPETALGLIGEALRPLPGAKSLVIFGWGFGRFGPGGVALDPDYGPARRALQESHAAVFSLDLTPDADYHTLEVALKRVSSDTGGFYAKTHKFAGSAMKRLLGALTGHYVLVVEKPTSRRGRHRIHVRLVGRKGTVLARASYLD
jgi:VWFA-related protein